MAESGIKTTERCGICHRVLDDPADPTTKNCGGDCVRCMADAGDPECQAFLKRLHQ